MTIRHALIALCAALALVACGTPTVQTVARVDNAILTRADLDKRIATRQSALKPQPGQPAPSPLDLERQVVGLFVQENLLLSVAKQRGITVSDQEIEKQIGEFRTNIAAAGSSIDEAITAQLGFSGPDSPEFRQFVSYYIAQQKLGETLVTTDTVRQQVEQQVMAEASKTVEKADVAHILVDTEDEAKQVIARLDKGEKFEDLAKELSKDPGSKDNGGVYRDIQKGQFVPEFDKAMFEDLKPGETTKTPVKTQFGYHVIRLLDRKTGPALTDEEAKQAIEQGVAQQLPQERQRALQDLIEAEKKKAKDEGRLEEPTYPDPTAVPPAQQAPQTPGPTTQP
jgi:parvulin-like peptidyl-prolyl isomerase